MKRIKELDTFYNCTMAAIYEYIILSVIGITVYKSAAYNINKTICLEKAASLLEYENRCRLDLRYTENFLNDAGTCRRKCSVHINNLNYRKTYFLREVNVTIGTNEKFTKSVCQQSHNTHVPMYMHIECLLWNEDKYRVIHNYNYPFNNSECVGINNHNICHCYDGYTIVNGYCIKGNIAVGGSCEHNKQCTGTADANICRSRKCACQTGYILIENNCYEGNIPVGYFCVHDEQCTRTRFASLCRSSMCTCQTGYTIVDNTCYKGNMTINQPCLHNRQCTGTKLAGLCSSGKCTCDTGYMLIDNNCYKDDSIGRKLGTLFGGILIGVILTAVVAFLIFKKLRTKIKKREDPIVVFANDALYSSAIVVEREDITGSQANDKKRKVVNVLPKGAVYGFETRKPRIEQPTTEGVYNHLHEQEKHVNDYDDNYDHACAASYLGTEPSV